MGVSVLGISHSVRRLALPHYLALGCALWGVGVAVVHVAAPFGVFGLSRSVPLLLATLPMAWLTLRLVERVSGGADGLLQAVSLVSMPALLLDGAALTWAPFVYGADEAQRRAAAAWLLWFVGASLALALVGGSRQTVTVPTT